MPANGRWGLTRLLKGTDVAYLDEIDVFARRVSVFLYSIHSGVHA
jgi:hypothetical protein